MALDERPPAGRSVSDRLAVEEVLEVRIDGRPIAVTMRTPGLDEELALGSCSLPQDVPTWPCPQAGSSYITPGRSWTRAWWSSTRRLLST
jgi:hypothetical protein